MGNTNNKTILLLGAGAEQQIAIELAKEMGYRVVAADGNPKAPGLALADVAIADDIKNIEKMIEVGKKHKVDGVMTHGVEIPHIISRIAKALNLPGIDPEIADRTTFKSERIKYLKRAGINVPEFVAVKTVSEAKKAAKKIGYPVVIKPTDNAGARGVKVVNNAAELEKAFNESLGYSHNREILIEQLLSGLEISTESLVYNGKIYTTGFGDRNYSRNIEFYPYFVEDGHNVPSALPAETQRKIISEVEKTIRALGITWGVAKGDILVNKSDDKVYVLEMASRTSGGWFCAGTVPLATGVHILKPLIKMSVGDPVDENDLKPTKDLAACQRYVIPSRDGTFIRIEGVKKAGKMPGVEMLVIFKQPKRGELIHKSTNHSERFGQLIAVGKDVKDATKKCEEAISCIRVVLGKVE